MLFLLKIFLRWYFDASAVEKTALYSARNASVFIIVQESANFEIGQCTKQCVEKH